MRSISYRITFVGILFIVACTGEELGSMQELAEGARLYETNCANCHQRDGSGLGRLLPPIQESEYYKSKLKNLPCLIQYGSRGGSVIKGIPYRLPMPAHQKLSQKQVLVLTKFVIRKFGDKTPLPPDTFFLNSLTACTIPALH